MKSKPVRVLIADDEEVMRLALADFFADDPRFALVGTATDADSAATLARDLQPDVALLDVRMPGGGQAAAKAIAICSPATKLIALSATDDRETVLQMIASGAMGYVVKGTDPNEILEAVARAAVGQSTLSPDIAGGVVDAVASGLHREIDAARIRAEKLARIERAANLEGVKIHYQPIWSLQSRSIAGSEALARFALEPQRTPDLWFAEAAAVGRVVELDSAVARLALDAETPDEVFLAINLSPETILADRLGSILQDRIASRVVVEVTEHSPVGDYPALAERLAEWRDRGVRVAVDDAGSGYASLRHILQLRPDIIKLDISLTRDIDKDAGRRALAAGFVAFAEASGATVVSEGIETRAELDTVIDMGISLGQGYLLGRPAPAETAFSEDLGPAWPG